MDATRLAELESRADPNDPEQQALLQEMKEQLHKLQELNKDQDPRLTFSTPEFKEAQRTFTEAFKKNFGRPIEYELVKEYAWSTPQLRKVEEP